MKGKFNDNNDKGDRNNGINYYTRKLTDPLNR